MIPVIVQQKPGSVRPLMSWSWVPGKNTRIGSPAALVVVVVVEPVPVTVPGVVNQTFVSMTTLPSMFVSISGALFVWEYGAKTKGGGRELILLFTTA